MKILNTTTKLVFAAIDGEPTIGGTRVGVYRAAVPGGWFVTVRRDDHFWSFFYPDPEHRWTGGSIDLHDEPSRA